MADQLVGLYQCSAEGCNAPLGKPGYCKECGTKYRKAWEAANAIHRRAYWRARRKGLDVPKKTRKQPEPFSVMTSIGNFETSNVVLGDAPSDGSNSPSGLVGSDGRLESSR